MEATLGTCKLGIIPARSPSKRGTDLKPNFGAASSLIPSPPDAASSAAAHQQSSGNMFLHGGASAGPLSYVSVHDPALNPFVDAFQFGVGAVASAAHVHQMQAHEAGTHMGLDLLDDALAFSHSHSYSTLNPVAADSSFSKKRGLAFDRSASSFLAEEEHDQRVVTIVDAIRWVSEAWRRLPVAAITKGFALARYDVPYVEPVAAASAPTALQQVTFAQVGVAGDQVTMTFAPSAVGLRATTGFPNLIIPPAPPGIPLVTLLPATPVPPALTAFASINCDEAPTYYPKHGNAPYSTRSSVTQQLSSQPLQLAESSADEERHEQPDDVASSAATNPVDSAGVLQMSVAEVIKDHLARSKNLKQAFGWSGFGRRPPTSLAAATAQLKKSKKPPPKSQYLYINSNVDLIFIYHM